MVLTMNVKFDHSCPLNLNSVRNIALIHIKLNFYNRFADYHFKEIQNYSNGKLLGRCFCKVIVLCEGLPGNKRFQNKALFLR